MAFCPKCGERVEPVDAACPRCGAALLGERRFTDHAAAFNADGVKEHRKKIAYSKWADLALIIGQIVSILGCVLTIVYSIIAILRGGFAQALIVGPIMFFMQLAAFVVFVRVQDLTKSQSDSFFGRS